MEGINIGPSVIGHVKINFQDITSDCMNEVNLKVCDLVYANIFRDLRIPVRGMLINDVSNIDSNWCNVVREMRDEVS